MTSIFDYLNPYAYAMRLRRRLFERSALKSTHPGIPVISIGNLAVGGTGKSPFVIACAEYIMARHRKRVAVISRGYRRRSKGFVLVRDGSQILAKVEDSGDEALMIAEALTSAIVIVDEDRAHGAREARRLGAQVIILDDGYQHLRLQRNLNVLLIDAERPLSAVLPFGRFREPFSAARAADAIVFSNATDKAHMRDVWERLKPYAKDSVIAAAIQFIPNELRAIAPPDNTPFPFDGLHNKRVFAVSGIASPARFHRMLEAAGAELVVRSFGDHAEYTAAFCQTLVRDAIGSGAEMIVTTAKDAVKSRRYFEQIASSIPVVMATQRLEFLSGERSFHDAIDRLL